MTLYYILCNTESLGTACPSDLPSLKRSKLTTKYLLPGTTLFVNREKEEALMVCGANAVIPAEPANVFGYTSILPTTGNEAHYPPADRKYARVCTSAPASLPATNVR